ADNLRFLVTGNEGGPDIPGDQPIGLIGSEILRNYDLDFDFAAAKLNLIEPDHCKGKVVYWPAQTIATIPFEVGRGFQIRLPLLVDGKPMTALLDTGASVSGMSIDTAKRIFRIDPLSAGLEKVRGTFAYFYETEVYRTQFRSITLNGV